MTLQRKSNGQLPGAAFPGGYSILYLCEDGEILCPQCANGENDSDASETAEDPSWRLVAAFVHWEGPEDYCSHCNKILPSEYGDPEEK
jgi:hypothetical protein